MILVLDASVILKWMLPHQESEEDSDRAAALLQSVIDGRHEILQPVHWMAEVAAVLARLSPDTASQDVQKMAGLEFATCDEPQVWRQACTLSAATGQHLFDTLYHAVALETDNAALVTADERYFRKVRQYCRILTLRDPLPVG